VQKFSISQIDSGVCEFYNHHGIQLPGEHGFVSNEDGVDMEGTLRVTQTLI
jgi:hypothetical protein